MRAIQAGTPLSVVAIVITALGLGGCSKSDPAKHKIRGTVSGLTGSGLRLQSAAGAVSITANGAFAFPTELEEGTAYSVTIVQQPTSPWQTCTVAGGSGTIGGADVTSVAVTCANNPYAVGGTVAGLAAGGTLKLRNNGTDEVTVAANGGFTFPDLLSGLPYDVTVSANPTGQTCTVANGSGFVGGAAITDVAVTCVLNDYLVGGTVTGLVAGGTLVLENNGVDPTTVTTNGAYAFAAPLHAGAAYAVTVQSKPASQTCTVANGAGTIAAADVTNVNVTCRTDTYAIRGTLTGLVAGGTLVLQDNGGDDLTLTADGAFGFVTSVASGSPYAVTVLSKPASQTCTVTNGAGTVGTADVTNVAVACTTDTYAVGGTIAGLAGTGLVLHSSVGTGEDLAVTAGATTFTFAQKAPVGASVTVTVKTQPSSPAETCTVAGSPVTVGVGDVASLAVSCTTAFQTWQAPTTWGGLWPDSATMVQHAYFDGSTIVETKNVTWTVANGSLPAQRELTAFPPGQSRWGAGPFDGPRYQATGGDAGFDFTGDMLVCAVVKPDFDPVFDGTEHVIFAKGVQDQAGWVLMQRHHMLNFYYRYDDGLGNKRTANAYTPTYFADASVPDNGPLNPSYLVVCGGRDGASTIVASANTSETTTTYPYTLPAGAVYEPGPTPHRLTIGGYDDNDPAHVFGGRVYETAIWNEPATQANIQAKFRAILGLDAGLHYTRNREGPITGPDGRYHTMWRNAPRVYVPGSAKASGGGFLFGLQGRNRLTLPFTPPDPASQVNPVIAYGEALDLWTKSGGATVLKDQLEPPGDSEQKGAERVTLPAGASISRTLDFFDSAGPIHGIMWIQRISTAGTLRVATTRPAGGTTSQHDVSLAALPSGQWSREWLSGLTNDGSQVNRATVSLTNTGASPIELYAWGVDLTQLGGGGDLGSFDPGLEMYDWTGTAGDDAYLIDVLQLPLVPTSTAATGFCLTVEAQPPAGLAWDAPFVWDRAPLTWLSDANSTDVVNLFMAGTGHGTLQGKLCAYVSTAVSSVCWAPTWSSGSQHRITVCTATNGTVTLYADGTAVGTPSPGAAPFDLATGHLVVGGNTPGIPGGSMAPWQGFVTRVAVCPAGTPAACR